MANEQLIFPDARRETRCADADEFIFRLDKVLMRHSTAAQLDAHLVGNDDDTFQYGRAIAYIAAYRWRARRRPDASARSFERYPMQGRR